MDRGNHDHRHVRIFFLGSLQQPDAVEFGHHQVREHQFKLLPGLQYGQCIHAGRGLPALIVSRR